MPCCGRPQPDSRGRDLRLHQRRQSGILLGGDPTVISRGGGGSVWPPLRLRRSLAVGAKVGLRIRGQPPPAGRNGRQVQRIPCTIKLIKQSNFEFLKGCPTARGRRRAACLESSRNGLTLFSTRSGRTTLCARYDKFPTKNNQTFATTRAATATCRSMT